MTAKTSSALGQVNRRLPIGAEPLSTGGVDFRLWSPRSKKVSVMIESDAGEKLVVGLARETGGYFSGFAPRARAGNLYRFSLDGRDEWMPDPASRFQPAGPLGPSMIIDAGAFPWRDDAWPGVRLEGQVIYEMHIGTFTPEGTWKAAIEKLAELKEVGITAVELMPVGDFFGCRGWGYDVVDFFAPTRLYGGPDDFRAFVDCAHALGLGVILDVVYNHAGPTGNYLKEFSPDYFTDRYSTDWGEPFNFDGPNSAPVREFFTANAGYWIAEFHLDGLRLDATQQIFDASPRNILQDIEAAVRNAAPGRTTYIVAENETQKAQLLRDILHHVSGIHRIAQGMR